MVQQMAGIFVQTRIHNEVVKNSYFTTIRQSGMHGKR